MSKRALTKYLQSLDKTDLENQVLELYAKFKPVRDYYGFVFNPKEDKLMEEARFKIAKEYFPTNGRKPKARRSVAHKLIKHFRTLELDPTLLSDLMLFNIETAIRFNANKPARQEAFYKSIFNSFEEAVEYIQTNGLASVQRQRLDKILDEVEEQQWWNAEAFERQLQGLFGT